jgi:UDP-2,4-diacetamido-2,4,6-trideoxy-beta-L-altropyranose hydrolase
MNGLLIRADGDARIGTGHVMRCLALAQGWQDAGGHVQLAMASSTPTLEERLKAEGIKVFHLAKRPGSAEDATQVVSLARQIDASWVVTDGYHFGAAYQQIIKASGQCLLFIDDYGHAGHYAADLVLNQNIYADRSLYTSCRPNTCLLLGTRYALLRREFWKWCSRRRKVPPVARRVLVTLGGADTDNVTLKVIQALQLTEIDRLEAVVVIGGSNPHAEKLRSAIRNRDIRLEHNVTDMPALMAWADLAVSAGGSTCWELAFMGLPSVILVLAENQQPVAVGLDAAGAAVSLGRPSAVTAVEIAETVTELAAAHEKRTASARRGRELVDGVGVARVVQSMQDHELTFRLAQADDCRLIWEWANDAVTRAASFSSKSISWEHHVEWFMAKLADPASFFYIALDTSSMPVGQIRYQVEGPEAVVSVSLVPEQRGRGYGSRIIRAASRQMFAATAIDSIHAYVKPDNAASIRAFTKAGFTDNGIAEVRGHLARHFVLRRGA